MSEGEMAGVQAALRSLASEARGNADFDSHIGAYLHSKLGMSPHESSQPEVWNFMTLVLVPDLVAQRFSQRNRINADRFLGAPFGGRNALGRLWWHRELLRHDADNPYELAEQLGEDQLVQIFERPIVFGLPLLAKSIAQNWLDLRGEVNDSEELMRDAVKRIRRLARILSFESLTDDELQSVVEQEFSASASSLNWQHMNTPVKVSPPSAFNATAVDLEAIQKLEVWIANSPLVEAKRIFVQSLVEGIRAGEIPTLRAAGIVPGSKFANGILGDLVKRGIRQQILDVLAS
jgi:hypothetical protein